MAQKKNYQVGESRFTAWGYGDVTSPSISAVNSFDLWFRSVLIGAESVDGRPVITVRVRRDGEDGDILFVPTSVRLTCLLDWLYLWLLDGEAIEYCPTFESWLTTMFICLQSIAWFNHDTNAVEVEVKDLRIFNLAEGDGDSSREEYRHPVLSREAYEQRRDQYNHDKLAMLVMTFTQNH